MRTLRSLGPAVIVLAGLGVAGAGDKKVLVPGDPPLTQDMVDDYVKLAAWRFGPDLDRVGGPGRLAQMIANDWANGDRARRKAILADVAWWREEFPKLSKADRQRLAARPATVTDPERARQAADAIHRLQLQQWNNAQQVQIRALSNLQAQHHETMMLIIANIRPSGRCVYNPSSGRYDRWVSD
jgi:hypothetical protein